MPNMNDQQIARLEAQLEKLVEGAFTHLFGKKIRAQDIAMELARSMEGSAQFSSADDSRPIAPDYYVIYLNPDTCQQLLERQPSLAQRLSEHMVELATNSGYWLNNSPIVDIQPNPELGAGNVTVRASHMQQKHSTTAVMKRVDLKPAQEAPRNPQLMIQGKQPIPLDQDVINIGRSRDNHIVVDDRAVSRYHLQIRLRFGRYTLFDTQSHGGTFVNDVVIKEHTLQNGDVIRIGNTRLVYIEDHPLSDSQTGHTMPVEPDSTR